MNFSYGRKPNPLFNPMHHSFANYSTDTMAKTELHRDFGDEIFLNNLHLIPDPLKKNLADTLITAEKPQIIKQKLEETTKMPAEDEKEMTGSTFSGIYSFISGVFNSLSGAMFRPKSPVYYDCFGSDSDWQQSNTEQDKIGPVSNPVATGDASDMSSKCRTAAKTCEGKLNEIRYVLSSPKPTTSVWYRKRPKKVFIEAGSVEEHFEDAFSPEDFIPMPNQTFIECYSPYTYQKEDLYQTGALKTKVEPPWRETANIVNVTDKDVQENSVLNDKHSSEHGKDTLNLEKDNLQSEKDNLNMENENSKMETEKLEMEKENLNSEKTDLHLDKETLDKTETNTKQNLDTKKEDLNITMLNTNSNLEIQSTSEKPISNLENQNSNLEQSIPSSLENTIDEVDCAVTDKQKLITSCEDKLSKLKALLCKNKRTRYTYNPEDSATKTMVLNSADKHYKNPHRTTDKRRKSKLKKNINDDMLFANEIDSEVIDESPLNSFTQTCLGDYFDEVTGRFRTTSTTDSDDSFQIVFNDTPRMRIPSECDSEDSFIIFEESPDSCYTSNDVFGASDTESDSEVSDSGCSTLTCKLSHSLSRTVSNLTDDSLYVESGDEIDSTNVETVLKCDEVNKSLLIDDEKKKSRKEQPVKKVHFSNDPPKVHLMRVWAFAARQARAGHWERYAVDRERFKRRIADVDMAVSWVLKPQHRSRVMFQRFMPWWNAQRRKELAEKKQREEEERNIQAELVKQQELLQQAELENREIAEKQMEEERVKQVELVKQQELLQQDELESKGLVENQMEEEMSKQQQLVKQEELLQQEDFETKELIETKQGELANQELLPQQEELIHQELREQQELLQHKDHDRLDNIKCIEEAKLSNENVPIFVQNNENNQEITKNSIPSDLNYDRTLDSSNEKSYSSDDCADFDKILPKERKKQSNFELV